MALMKRKFTVWGLSRAPVDMLEIEVKDGQSSCYTKTTVEQFFKDRYQLSLRYTCSWTYYIFYTQCLRRFPAAGYGSFKTKCLSESFDEFRQKALFRRSGSIRYLFKNNLFKTNSQKIRKLLNTRIIKY